MTRRIIAVVVTVTALAIVAFSVPAALAVQRAQERGELLELQREAFVIANGVSPTSTVDDLADAVVDAGQRLGVYGADRQLIGGDGPPTADDTVARALDGEFAERRVGGDLVAAVPVSLPDGGDVVVRIEMPRRGTSSRLTRALAELAAAAIVVMVIAAAIAVWLARRLNRPIEELREWAADDAQRSPPGPTGIGELDSLRADLIADRERIEELVERERSFSSYVSHQLRTPVAAMRVAIETETEAPRADSTEILAEVLGRLDALEAMIVSLLAVARHTRRTVADVDLAAVVVDRLERWRDAAPAGRSVEASVSSSVVATDADAVGHIVDVLIENALRHGRGDVRVTVGDLGSATIIDVGDAGPRPTHDPMADVTAGPTHGIGLRLARTLASELGATLVLLDAPRTTFRLSLPRRTDAVAR